MEQGIGSIPRQNSEFANMVPRRAQLMDQPHMLAYINPAEELMLRKMGGAGIPGPDGIPVYGFYEDVTGTKFEDTNLGKAMGVTAGSGLGSGGNLDRAYNSVRDSITGGGAGDNPSGVPPKQITSVQQSNKNIQDANAAAAARAAETAKAEAEFAEKTFLEKMSADFKSLIGLDFGVNQQALRNRTNETLKRNALEEAYYSGNDDANLRQGTYGGSGGFASRLADQAIDQGLISTVGSSSTAPNAVDNSEAPRSGLPRGQTEYATNVVVPSGTGFVGQMSFDGNSNNQTQYTFEELLEMYRNNSGPTGLFG
tara:strand:- start:61 stop:993 length:933 start_codon:yes stop_codon:yes gene_type:complete